MEYLNFDLWIQKKRDGCYPVTVIPPKGAEECLCDNILSPKMLADLELLDDNKTNSELLKAIGGTLYECLFRESIRDSFKENFAEVRDKDEMGLRIRLIIDPPEIAALPWELLYDRKQNRFLATWDKTSVTRYLNFSESNRSLTVEPPVKVLVAIPTGSGLDVDKEKNIVSQAFEELINKKLVEIDFLEGRVTATTINDKLNDSKYHIFHFIGHGCFHNEEGYLRFNLDKDEDTVEGEDCEDENLEARGWLSAEAFADLFMSHRSMKLVVLNSCQGAQVSTTKPFVGLVPRLFGREIPAVVAMRYPIFDESAILFSSQFYRKLCRGRERGLIDVAIANARNLIHIKRQDGVDFATPVLFLHASTGLLFDLKEAAPDAPDVFQSTINLDADAAYPIPVPTATFAATAKSLWHKISESLQIVGEASRLKAVRQVRGANLEALEKEKELVTEEAKRIELEQEIEEEKREVAHVEKQLRKVFKILLWGTIISLAAGLIIFLAAFFGVLNVIGVDDWLQRASNNAARSSAMGNFSDDVRIILVDEHKKTDGFPSAATQNDRGYHAELIEALTQANAKVVAFDVFFGESVPALDSKLAEAIKRASRAGTQVIAAVRLEENGKPERPVTEGLQEALKDKLGNTRVGISYEFGFPKGIVGLHTVTRYVELAKARTGEQREARADGGIPVAPSLMLQAIRQFDAKNPAQPPEPFFYRDQRLIRLLDQNGDTVREIPVVDDEMSFMLGAADDEVLKRVGFHYQDVYAEIKRQNLEYLRSNFQGKIVMVGYQKGPKGYDRHYVSGVEQRFGVEIQANVISNIFQKIYLKKLPWVWNFLLIVLMGLIGFLLQTRWGRQLRYRLPLEMRLLRKTVKIPVPLIVVTLLYFIALYFVYSRTLYVIDITYHLAALFIAYLIASLRRRIRETPLKRIQEDTRKEYGLVEST